MAVLRELTIWRDRSARAHDVPPRAFLKDEILLDMARSPVKSLDRLERVRGLPRPVEHAHGAEIVEATNRAWSSPPPDLPSPRDVEPTPTERFRSDALWAAAQCVCVGQGIDPAVATSRNEMAEFFRALDAGGDLSGLRVMTGWRREALGEPLRTLVRESGRMELQWAGETLALATPRSQPAR
jgi:ribonuclease D